MICDYNTHCFKCNNLIFKEKEYIRSIHDRHTTVEKQIDFFQTEMSSPIFLSDTNRTNVRVMRREIDTLMDTPELKERFKHEKLHLLATKSYVKKYWISTYHILKYFHDLAFMKDMRKIRVWWFQNLEVDYYFRNRTIKIKDIMETFLREYLKELFRYYEHYINEPEIEEHIHKNIDT